MRPIHKHRRFVHHRDPWRPGPSDVFKVEVTPSERETRKGDWLAIPNRFDVLVILQDRRDRGFGRRPIAEVERVPGRSVDVVGAQLRLWAWERVGVLEDDAVYADRATTRAAER